jgi:predicted ATPase
MGSGAIHLMGLIDLSLKFGDMGVQTVWVYPETFLHPGWQVALGDLLIYFMNRGAK